MIIGLVFWLKSAMDLPRLTGQALLDMLPEELSEKQIDVVILKNERGDREEVSFRATKEYLNVVGIRKKSLTQ